MNRIKKVFLIVFVLTSIICCKANNIIRINSIVVEDNGVFHISAPIDLKGNVLVIPKECTLNFSDSGIIKNGIIRGQRTNIAGKKKKGIFDDVKLEGTWLVPNISTKLFKHVDANTLANLSVLSSSDIQNTIFVEENCVAPILEFSSVFIIKSNTDVYLKADIQSLPTDFKGGYVMFVRGNNINIYGGGHKLKGTIRKYSKNKEQWQHGLCINIDASNVYVENLVCNEFWGDGIYTRGSNVTINKVTCLYNGRQGLSITYGENIRVMNSVFRFTGKYGLNKTNGPGAGIDIEPNSKDYVKNILVEKCILTNNSAKTFGDVNDLEIFRAPDSNIRFRECKIGGIYLGSSSDISFERCSISKPIYAINTSVFSVRLYQSGHPDVDDTIQKQVKVY